MKNYISLALIMFSVLLVSACVSVPQDKGVNKNQLAISSVRDTPIYYEQGSSFILSPKYVKDTSLKAKQTQAIYTLYTQALSTNLTTHGFNQATDTKPSSFEVVYGVALTSDLSDKKIHESLGITPGLLNNNTLKKGSFLLSIKDTFTGVTVWRGAVQGFAHEGITKEERVQRVAEIVQRAIQQFYVTNKQEQQ